MRGWLELKTKDTNEIIMIYGMPAVGKTMISVVLADELQKKTKKRVFLVSGDKLANIYYGGAHDNDSLNLKYRNFESILKNLVDEDAYIIIDDFFKRKDDFQNIKNIFENAEREFVIIRIECDLKERLIRDAFRDSGNQLGTERMHAYQKRYIQICKELPYDICVNSGLETINSIVCAIEDLIWNDE